MSAPFLTVKRAPLWGALFRNSAVNDFNGTEIVVADDIYSGVFRILILPDKNGTEAAVNIRRNVPVGGNVKLNFAEGVVNPYCSVSEIGFLVFNIYGCFSEVILNARRSELCGVDIGYGVPAETVFIAVYA